MRFKSQIKRDEHRESYLVTFPTDLDAERVLAWLRSVTGTLPKRKTSRMTVETMVFETWATAAGITHRLMVPASAAEYISAQLRTHGRGINVTKEEGRPQVDWTAGVELGMSNPARTLRIVKHSDIAASLLGSVQALQGDEAVMIQWVITPAPFERMPSREFNAQSTEFKYRSALTGPHEASNDELQDRRQKLSEQNMLAIGRVVTKANTPKRASELVLRVESALSSTNSAGNYFKSRGGKASIGQDANDAASLLSFRFPAQLTLTELAAVIAWPIGQPFVAGLTKGASRHFYATADVPSEGRILGNSNFEGHERPIALSYDWATEHMTVIGSSGTGKTSFLLNCWVQDVSKGYGGFIIDAGDSRSDETLFSGAIRSVPPGMEDRVIVINVVDDRKFPVGFNPLTQGNPRAVAGRVVKLFTNLYRDVSTGIWTPQLLHHAVFTLAEKGGHTLLDIMPLLNPQTEAEIAWSKGVISGVKDRDVQDWWTRWNGFDKSERQRNIQPLYNRIWNLSSRPEIRNIIGQKESTFSIREALESNKIVLINLAGADEVTAQIFGDSIRRRYMGTSKPTASRDSELLIPR